MIFVRLHSDGVVEILGGETGQARSGDPIGVSLIHKKPNLRVACWDYLQVHSPCAEFSDCCAGTGGISRSLRSFSNFRILSGSVIDDVARRKQLIPWFRAVS